MTLHEDTDTDLERLVQEALASRRVPVAPDAEEIEIYDEDTGWICLDHLFPEEPEEPAEYSDLEPR